MTSKKTKYYCIHCDKYYYEITSDSHYTKNLKCKKMHNKLLEYIDSGVSLDLSEQNIKNIVDKYFTFDVFLSGYIGLFDVLFNNILFNNEEQLFVFVNNDKKIIYYRDKETNRIKSDRNFSTIIHKYIQIVAKKIDEYRQNFDSKDKKLISFLTLLVNEYNIRQLNGKSELPTNLTLENIVNNLDTLLEHIKNN